MSLPTRDPLGPASRRARAASALLLFVREVDAGEQDLSESARRPSAPTSITRPCEHVERAVRRRCGGASCPARARAEQGALAVERARGRSSSCRRRRRAAALTRPPRPRARRAARPTCSTWPISGCASSAFRECRSRSRVIAAAAASRSYAADVLGEAEQLGRERRLRQRLGPAAIDARRHLDDVVGGEPGERAVVSNVDLVHGAVVARQRRDEPDRSLAVERAAALLEQRRLLRRAPDRGTARAARARSRRRLAARGVPIGCSASTRSCA